MRDDETEEYVMKKSSSSIENSEVVYAKAPDKEECVELFKEAQGGEE